MSLDRRVELLDIASRQGSWIFEDDYNSEFHFRERPIAALRSLDFSGRVIYVGTFSKTLFPSLRLGYIVCPPGIREDLCKVKRDEVKRTRIREFSFLHRRCEFAIFLACKCYDAVSGPG